jgi:hypothetical protein
MKLVAPSVDKNIGIGIPFLGFGRSVKYKMGRW